MPAAGNVRKSSAAMAAEKTMVDALRRREVEPPRPLSVAERYRRIAPFYDLLDFPFEYGRYRRIRPLIFDGLKGRVLDAGVGTGRNMPFYPPDASMVGIDLSRAMLERAESRHRALEVDIDLRQMDVTALDFPDRSFDAAVATFLFCVLPEDQQAAGLSELARVVKPGGPIRLLEYVRPSGAFRGAMARLWEPWMAWAYGAGFDRNTEAHARAAGLEIIETRFVVGDLLKFIAVRAP